MREVVWPSLKVAGLWGSRGVVRVPSGMVPSLSPSWYTSALPSGVRGVPLCPSSNRSVVMRGSAGSVEERITRAATWPVPSLSGPRMTAKRVPSSVVPRIPYRATKDTERGAMAQWAVSATAAAKASEVVTSAIIHYFCSRVKILSFTWYFYRSAGNPVCLRSCCAATARRPWASFPGHGSPLGRTMCATPSRSSH